MKAVKEGRSVTLTVKTALASRLVMDAGTISYPACACR